LNHLKKLLFLTAYICYSLFCWQAKAYSGPTDSAISFRGVNSKIAYVANRQLGDASFVIKNNTKQRLRVNFEGAVLLRGNTQEILMKSGFKAVNNALADIIIINPKSELKIKVAFKPFVIYEGSPYKIKATISVDGQSYEAVSIFETFRQAVGDKNKYKKQ
jgi:hypothetical protein